MLTPLVLVPVDVETCVELLALQDPMFGEKSVGGYEIHKLPFTRLVIGYKGNKAELYGQIKSKQRNSKPILFASQKL